MLTKEDCIQILNKLEPNSDITIEFSFIKTLSCNTKKRIIFIGLLELRNHTYDEMEAGIAHELGHIKLKHVVGEIERHKAEFEADMYAYQHHRISTYAAIFSLLKGYKSSDIEDYWYFVSNTHPSLLARAIRLGLDAYIFEDIKNEEV